MDNIRELLEVTSDPGSENRLTVGDVKAWLAEYIEMRADEVANFPTEATAIHWDLVAANYHASKDAHFVVAYFSSDYATLMGGRGSIPLVRGLRNTISQVTLTKFLTPWPSDSRRVIAGRRVQVKSSLGLKARYLFVFVNDQINRDGPKQYEPLSLYYTLLKV